MHALKKSQSLHLFVIVSQKSKNGLCSDTEYTAKPFKINVSAINLSALKLRCTFIQLVNMAFRREKGNFLTGLKNNVKGLKDSCSIGGRGGRTKSHPQHVLRPNGRPQEKVTRENIHNKKN